MERIQQPVYTETNNCQDCYKCIRECPVKAIKIESDRASIVKESCIFCGHCTQICPVNAKKIRNDLDKVKAMLQENIPVYVSLAPSYYSEFSDFSTQALIGALLKLGFCGVSETALGAELYSKEAAAFLNSKNSGIYISSACPSVVDLIRKYYPEFTGNIVQQYSPMLAHGQQLHRWFGKDIRVVFIGPCVAKKTESDDLPGIINVALTFADLRHWLDEAHIHGDDDFGTADVSFVPYTAGKGSLYPMDGGMIQTLSDKEGAEKVFFMNVSGVKNIRDALMGTENWNKNSKVFLELLACEGGCICGPGTTVKGRSLLKKMAICQRGEQIEKPIPLLTDNAPADIQINYCYLPSENKERVWSDDDIAGSLRSAGKLTPEDEMNCGGCGYNSCREFAIAMLNGMAERQMCVSYMRKVASDKASVLLQKMPSGVVIADENLKIIECNESFARLLGEDASLAWEARPGMKGSDLKKWVSFHKMFTTVLNTGNDLIDKDIIENKLTFDLSVVSIQKHKIVCGILNDMHQPGIRQQEILKRTRNVIHENLATVQKVAFLLGENAAHTEAMLNTIAESLNVSAVYENE